MRPEEIDMKDVWAVEQSILDQIARVCDDHGLRWSLAYGTLLGAVRHGGFIPWDDDVDIMMPREDYEKLMALWPEVAPAGLILDRCDRDPENCNVFSKVRKDHTTFLQFPNEGQAAHHKGIFNDIFPAEHVPKGKLARKLQFADFAVMLLFRVWNAAVDWSSINQEAPSNYLEHPVSRIVFLLNDRFCLLCCDYMPVRKREFVHALTLISVAIYKMKNGYFHGYFFATLK